MKRNAPGKPVKPTTVLRVEFVAWVRERAVTKFICTAEHFLDQETDK